MEALLEYPKGIVSNLRQKMPRLKLPLADYRVLRNQVLKREMALPTLRSVKQFARPPHEITQQAWRRRVAESDYLVRKVSRSIPPA